MEAWDFKRKARQEVPPTGGPIPALCAESNGEFVEYYIHELKAELECMRYREARRRGEEPVDGLTIETKLGHMLGLLRRKFRNRNIFHGIATTIDQCFNQEQRRMLFELLDDIEDQGYRPVDGALAKAHLKWVFRRERRHPDIP